MLGLSNSSIPGGEYWYRIVALGFRFCLVPEKAANRKSKRNLSIVYSDFYFFKISVDDFHQVTFCYCVWAQFLVDLYCFRNSLLYFRSNGASNYEKFSVRKLIFGNFSCLTLGNQTLMPSIWSRNVEF